MKVKEIMKKEVITVSPDTSFEEGVKLLFKSRISGMPVVNRRKTVVGLVSEKDFFRALHPSYQEYYESPISFTKFEELERDALAKVKSLKVRDIMTQEVEAVSVNTPLLKIGAIMLAKHIHRLPVIDGRRKLLGIVSRRDIYRAIFRNAFDL